MTKKNEQIMKQITVKLQKPTWMFLKQVSSEQEKPLNTILNTMIDKFKEKQEKNIKKDVDM